MKKKRCYIGTKAENHRIHTGSNTYEMTTFDTSSTERRNCPPGSLCPAKTTFVHDGHVERMVEGMGP